MATSSKGSRPGSSRRAYLQQKQNPKSGQQGAYLIAVVVGMVGLTYASVPLYRQAPYPPPWGLPSSPAIQLACPATAAVDWRALVIRLFLYLPLF